MEGAAGFVSGAGTLQRDAAADQVGDLDTLANLFEGLICNAPGHPPYTLLSRFAFLLPLALFGATAAERGGTCFEDGLQRRGDTASGI